MAPRKPWLAVGAVLGTSLTLLTGGSAAAMIRSAPVDTSSPTISGRAFTGATLAGGRGTWTGTPNGYSYQWLRCDGAGSHCAPLTGAIGKWKSPTASDLGSTLRFTVIASNRDGSTSATSAPTAVVAQTTSPSVAPSTPGNLTVASPIYWGAYIEGQQTYSYLYGGTWGNAPWDARTWTRFEQNAGKSPSIIHWGMSPAFGHDFTYWQATLNLVQGSGALNLIDLSTGSDSLAAIARGSRDAYWKTFAQEAAAYGRPFFLRFDWEMNGNWFPWGTTSSNQNTPGDFVAAWRHVHDIFAAARATNVTWVWCPNLEFGGSVPYSRLYPGDTYVDWTCLDGYNKGTSSESFAGLFNPSYADLVSVAPTKPIMIGEVASLEYAPTVKATWISTMLSALPTSFPRIKALAWFNWRINDGGTWDDFQIESSASSLAAFAAAIGSQHYAAAGAFLMPAPLRPIQPLP